MNTYKWTCRACDTPNVLVHDPEEREQVTLNCLQCGQAGTFEPVTRVMKMVVLEERTDVASTCAVPATLMASNVYVDLLQETI